MASRVIAAVVGSGDPKRIRALGEAMQQHLGEVALAKQLTDTALRIENRGE